MRSRLRSSTNLTLVFTLLAASMAALSLVGSEAEADSSGATLFPTSELELLVTEEEEIVVEVPLLDI